MNARLLGRLISLSCLLLGNAVAAAQPAAPSTASHIANPYALLIGCTAYPELGRRYQLRGPSNDVALTRELLRGRFGFADAQIVALIHENEPSLRPTYDNIVREFDALIRRVGPGDNVFVLVAGHGSQLKDDNPDDPNDGERDGLDEVFLPEDVTRWKTNQPVVKAIRDDQFRTWLDAIRARGALVFFVADTCHSGTLNRGAGGDEEPGEDAFFHYRSVDPWAINSPDELGDLPETVDAADDRENDAVAITQPDGKRGGLVALYAVDERTAEAEHPMPPANRLDGPHYGRLTFALNAVLAGSQRPLTYRELAQQIRWRYEGWDWRDLGYMLATPEELDREVLGRGRWQNRSAVILSRDEYGRLSINAGVLRGASVGSVYRVYEPIGRAHDETAAGCVRITEATPTSARVEPCAWDGVPLAAFDKLPAPGRCELAYGACDALKMSVEITPWLDDVDDDDFVRVEKIIGALASEKGALIRRANENELPDALVLVDGDRLYLRRTFDAVQPGDDDEVARFPTEAFGPFPAASGVDSKLAIALHAMAKATNLRRVATVEPQAAAEESDESAVTLSTKIERLNPNTGQYEVVDSLESLDVYDGDKLRVSVFNRGAEPVDVTLLYIESAFRIRSYFPTAAQDLRGGFNNRLTPGGPPAVVQFSINDSTIGLEDVLVIASLPAAGSPPQNFVFLEQPGLTSDRGGEDARSALKTPAGQLLATLGFGRGDRGGASAPDLATFAVHRLSWTVRRRDPAVP